MIISDHKKIKNIQEEFSQRFPFLKLKFYKYQHAVNHCSKSSEEWSNELTIGEIRRQTTGKDLPVIAKMKIKDFETKVQDEFGLNVQVFRTSTHNVWLQSTTTDDWTLFESNEKAGAVLSNN